MMALQDDTGKWYRMCSCGRKIIYSNKMSALSCQSQNKNNTCRSCSQEGKKNRNFGNPCLWNKNPKSVETLHKHSIANLGKRHTEDTKKKISNGTIERFLRSAEKEKLSVAQSSRYRKLEERTKTSKSVRVAMRKPDIRKKHLNALHHSKWIKVRTDKGQLELLEKWNRLGFNFEPNYQVKTDSDLFYIDGYDKEKNVVLEYDSKYHQRKSQKQKDLIRQNRLIDILKPKKFWRFNSETKQYESVLGE